MKKTGRPRTLVLLLAWLLAAGAEPAGAAATDQTLVRTEGTLPSSGTVVIRSGLSWLTEDQPAFRVLANELARQLGELGLDVISVPPSVPAPLPSGTEAIRNASVPGAKGSPTRTMSLAEAISRMKAMQLAREGKLPQTKYGQASSAPRPVSTLTPQEVIRFALSQEQGAPQLRGQISIPGRIPPEVTRQDPAAAGYCLVARFAMLWPASGMPDGRPPNTSGTGRAIGWHLLQMECYDLAPVPKGGKPLRVWQATVQQIAHGPQPRTALSAMAGAAFHSLSAPTKSQ